MTTTQHEATVPYYMADPWKKPDRSIIVTSSKNAVDVSGLNWTVEKRDIWADAAIDGFPGTKRKIKGFKANVRTDTGETLGIVTDQYKVVQNADGFKFIDSLLDSGEVEFEAAGSIRGGRRVWMLARIPADMVVGRDDVLNQFVFFLNSHDGSSGVIPRLLNRRIFCNNMISGIIRTSVMIRHTGNVDEKIRLARETVQIAKGRFAEFHDYAETLNRIQLREGMISSYFEKVVPDPEPDEDGNVDNESQVRTRGRIAEYFEREVQIAHDNNLPVTAWTAFNGVAAYNTHGKQGRSDPDRRFTSTVIGEGSRFSQRAFDIAVEHFIG